MSDNNKGPDITPENVEAVQRNWALLTSDWKVKGPDFFMSLFKTHPYIKGYFKMFENMSDNDIKKSNKLRAHAINFRLGVTSYVENLDDLDTVVILIQKTVWNHYRRNIRAQEFRDALGCFLNFTKESGGADTFTHDSWRKVLKVVGDVVEAHMNELDVKYSGTTILQTKGT